MDYGSSGTIYVVDTNNHRIQEFDSKGKFLNAWGYYGSGLRQFDNPVSVNVEPISGNIYVSDAGNKRIVIYDEKGNRLGGWGTDGIDDGEFERPVSVAFGKNGRVYVVDKDRGDIQIFQPDHDNSVSQMSKTTSVSSQEGGKYQAKVSLNFSGDCWMRAVFNLNDGDFGRNLVKKSIGSNSGNDKSRPWENVILKFDGKEVTTGRLQAYVEISGPFWGSIYDSQPFVKDKNSYTFRLEEPIECS